MANKLRVYWPGDQLCHSYFYTAMRTRGIRPICGHDGVLPGRAHHTDPRPVCLTCAGIPRQFHLPDLRTGRRDLPRRGLRSVCPA
ncbi:hypothetical protein OKHIL_47620 [Mycolicibacterium mageritense]|nr:hypothetical protein MTY414_71630 [Mycolicibacterium mageritense]